LIAPSKPRVYYSPRFNPLSATLFARVAHGTCLGDLSGALVVCDASVPVQSGDHASLRGMQPGMSEHLGKFVFKVSGHWFASTAYEDSQYHETSFPVLPNAPIVGSQVALIEYPAGAHHPLFDPARHQQIQARAREPRADFMRENRRGMKYWLEKFLRVPDWTSELQPKEFHPWGHRFIPHWPSFIEGLGDYECATVTEVDASDEQRRQRLMKSLRRQLDEANALPQI
jgi:hypothetical protein